MNKYQEALDNIGSLYMYDEDGEADCVLSESFMKSDYDILKELVDKETPKKPEIKKLIRKNNYRDERNIPRYDWWCPNCHLEHMSANVLKYCPTCGQALDWSE